MLLTQVNLIFSSLTEAETNEELQAIAKEISPKLTEHYDNISLNGELFARIKTVYENRDKENLDTEQMKVLETTTKTLFVRVLFSPKKIKPRFARLTKNWLCFPYNTETMP